MMEKQKLIDLCIANGVEHDINKRWEEGFGHHTKSVALGKQISTVDFLLGDDAGDWNFGGDGDNGEALLYTLDIIFELQDKGVTL